MASKNVAADIEGISKDDEVNPWEVKSASDKGIDYEKLITKFGSCTIDESLLERFKIVTGIGHRSLDNIN